MYRAKYVFYLLNGFFVVPQLLAPFHIDDVPVSTPCM